MWYKKPLSAYHFTVPKMDVIMINDPGILQNQKVYCRILKDRYLYHPIKGHLHVDYLIMELMP